MLAKITVRLAINFFFNVIVIKKEGEEKFHQTDLYAFYQSKTALYKSKGVKNEMTQQDCRDIELHYQKIHSS